MSAKAFPKADTHALKEFFQKQGNRLQAGHLQYGIPSASKKYMTRLQKEFTAYKRTGNMEHLLNIANYAWLESIAPEHKKFHFDNTADSVTRPIVKDRGVFSFHENQD